MKLFELFIITQSRFKLLTSGKLYENIPLKNLEAYFDARVKTGHTLKGWKKSKIESVKI